MELIVYRKLKVLPVILFLSIFITGCNPLIIIEAGKNSAVQELYVDNYKMQVRITLLSDENEYLCSFLLFNRNDIKPLEGIKSYMDIIRYGPRRHRYAREKFPYLNGLELIYNKITNEYECKYKFTSKSKYELTIRLNEIAGEALEEDLVISFDQEAK
ncbi:hypothetical protein APF79_06965 [bacterium BRH_c32]|nr:MAG: hypothetical protein APF79_13845 [bacterium BRH_c32]KUO63507.1 MAG: hypothetical protein APF79_06965 [bacterium BRH_c32]